MKNKETKLIKEAWDSLYYAFDPESYHRHVDRVLDLTLEESKQYDKFRGPSISRGISVITEAKYFAVKRVVGYLQGESAPSAKYYFSMQKSCYAAYAASQSDYALKWWAKTENQKLANLIASWDYCELIKDDDRRRGFKSSPGVTPNA